MTTQISNEARQPLGVLFDHAQSVVAMTAQQTTDDSSSMVVIDVEVRSATLDWGSLTYGADATLRCQQLVVSFDGQSVPFHQMPCSVIAEVTETVFLGPLLHALMAPACTQGTVSSHGEIGDGFINVTQGANLVLGSLASCIAAKTTDVLRDLSVDYRKEGIVPLLGTAFLASSVHAPIINPGVAA